MWAWAQAPRRRAPRWVICAAVGAANGGPCGLGVPSLQELQGWNVSCSLQDTLLSFPVVLSVIPKNVYLKCGLSFIFAHFYWNKVVLSPCCRMMAVKESFSHLLDGSFSDWCCKRIVRRVLDASSLPGTALLPPLLSATVGIICVVFSKCVCIINKGKRKILDVSKRKFFPNVVAFFKNWGEIHTTQGILFYFFL